MEAMTKEASEISTTCATEAPVTVSWQGVAAGITHKATFAKPAWANHVRVEVQTFKGDDKLPVRVEWARLNILAVLANPEGRFRMPRSVLPTGDSELERQLRQEFNKHFPRRVA